MRRSDEVQPTAARGYVEMPLLLARADVLHIEPVMQTDLEYMHGVARRIIGMAQVSPFAARCQVKLTGVDNA